MQENGRLQNKLPHVYVGKEIFSEMVETLIFIANTPEKNMEHYKYATPEEMFQGSQGIFLNCRIHTSPLLKKQEVLTPEAYLNLLEKEINQIQIQ